MQRIADSGALRPAGIPGAFSMALAAVAIGLSFPATPAHAGEADVTAAKTDIQATLGHVPRFIDKVSKAALPGAWAEVKAVEFSDDTALPAKTKALISLAVLAQIPCQYCIWQDTESAKAAGATEEEIAEAVAISALSRHWSTIFNGMQIDFGEFKADLGGADPGEKAGK